MRLIASCLLVFSVLHGAPGLASADRLAGPSGTPTDAEIVEARGLYQQGNAAADAGQFADALSFYTRAFALSGNPAALYNAARTLRSLGRHADAWRAFEQLLNDVPELSDTTRAEATQLRDEEAARVARLSLDEVPAASPDLQLHIDGVFHPDGGARPIELELDAGQHGLIVALTGFQPFTWQGTLAEGAHERVTVSLTPTPQGRSIAEEPVFWIIVAAVVIAGAVVGGYFIWDAEQLRPNAATVIRL